VLFVGFESILLSWIEQLFSKLQVMSGPPGGSNHIRITQKIKHLKAISGAFCCFTVNNQK
jgi:hypothetical protein